MIERTKVNDTIGEKEKPEIAAPKKSVGSAIVAYNANWQFPAITEEHAFKQISSEINLCDHDGRVIYLAFPWATLIDNLLHNKKNPDKTAFLRKQLLSLKPELKCAHTVITTCQHIHMMCFQSLFQELGITDIFWSHAIKGQTALPEYPQISIHPFPLYPVQTSGFVRDPDNKRKYLFSFVGAKANQYYLTQSRNIIIDELSEIQGGFIAGNASWHYNKIVYDYQIRGLVDKTDSLVDISASDRFRLILEQSVFSLCPSGTGPNSIRLWESIGLGAIPVIIADTLELPGDPELWREAAVFCKENRESITALPRILEKMCGDAELLKRKRHAMAQLWELYGIDNFVCDIKKLMLERMQESAPDFDRSHPESDDGDLSPSTEFTASLDLRRLTTGLLLSPQRAIPDLSVDRAQVEALMSKASPEQKDIFIRALRLRNLDNILDRK